MAIGYLRPITNGPVYDGGVMPTCQDSVPSVGFAVNSMTPGTVTESSLNVEFESSSATLPAPRDAPKPAVASRVKASNGAVGTDAATAAPGITENASTTTPRSTLRIVVPLYRAALVSRLTAARAK